MTKETKELTKQETTAVSTQQNVADAGISTSDLQISRLSIMNALSELVKSGEFRIGDIVDGGSEEKLGDAKAPVEIVILKSFKYWNSTKNNEYIKGSRRPAVSQNDMPWTEEGGIKNIYNHSFYLLLRKDLEEGIVFPYTINFRSTEVKKAKRICTILYRMAQKGIASYGHYFKFSTKEEKAGSNTWMGAKIEVGDAVPQELQAKALETLKMLNTAESAGAVKHEEEKPEGFEDNGDF